jgi:hypothetical protein
VSTDARSASRRSVDMVSFFPIVESFSMAR